MVGSEEDPKDGPAVAAAVFGAVGIYGVRSITYYHLPTFSYILTLLQLFLVFCASQAWLHKRERRNGAIALN